MLVHSYTIVARKNFHAMNFASGRFIVFKTMRFEPALGFNHTQQCFAECTDPCTHRSHIAFAWRDMAWWMRMIKPNDIAVALLSFQNPRSVKRHLDSRARRRFLATRKPNSVGVFA